jgi:hypothetical protein
MQSVLRWKGIVTMIRAGSFSNPLAVKILVCVAGFLVLAGCTHTPKIYKMPPGQVEKIRSDLGVIGVTISSYPLKRRIIKPAKGVLGGAARGVVIGAAMPVAIGAVSPVPGGTAMGALISPYTAAAGMVYGAIKAVPPAEVKKAEAASDRAIARLQEMNLRQSFMAEVVKLGKERTDLMFVPLSDMGPRHPKEVVQYSQMDIPGIYYILELRPQSAGLRGVYSINPPSTAFMEVTARLIRKQNNEVVISEKFICASEVERTYAEWAENDGQLFIDEFLCCLPELAEKIVDDLFLVYPLASR